MPINQKNLAPESGAAMLALIVSGVVWGIVWIPLKYFSDLGLSGHAVGLTAYALVALVSLPFIWRERLQWRPEWKLLLLIGLFFGWANMALTLALMTGSVVRTMLLFFLLPAWGALGGALFLREKIDLRRMMAVLLSLAGVIFIMGGPDIFEEPFSIADLIALSAGLFYTAAGIVNRKAQQIPMASRTLMAFVGCALLAFFGLAISTPSLPEMNVTSWLWLAVFAFVWLLGGTLLTTFGVTHVQASRAAVLQVAELVVAVLTAVWLGGELMGVKEIAGATLIISATLIEALSYGALKKEHI